MPGKICDIISGGRTGQVAFVSNKQERAFLDKGKVHAYFFDKDKQALLNDGKHLNGLIAIHRLKVIGLYD